MDDVKALTTIEQFIDPAAEIYLPEDVVSELYRCARQNGRIRVDYLLAIYRCGRAHERAALAAPRPSGEREAPADLVALRDEILSLDTAMESPGHRQLYRRWARVLAAQLRPSTPGERQEIRGRVFRVGAVRPLDADFVPDGAKQGYIGEDGGSALDVAIVAVYRDPLWRRS